ncbi:CMRF35-like molecule 1 isoform X1 [Carcharodon carcharias]|uniref:CMRF35-like molecule 1 isoform X1 n=1 Tax=Carcharodon carcharias TaxID=13397 RepID=UPI001B7E852F|nr:CMRF35-like molecule 1 isoform X1 [Carcharodon carcharias]
MDFKAMLLVVLIAAGSCKLRGPTVINGILAERVTVQLGYDQEDETYTKSWCKVIDGKCINITDTAGYVNELYLGRASITDDKRSRILSITLQQMRKEDAGQYVCGIRLSQQKYRSFWVELKVLEAPLTSAPSSTITNLKSPLSLPMKWNFVFLAVVLYLSLKLLAAVIIFVVLLKKHRGNGEIAKCD